VQQVQQVPKEWPVNKVQLVQLVLKGKLEQQVLLDYQHTKYG